MSRSRILIFMGLWATAGVADPGNVPKLPVFDTDTDPEQVLQDYPLGVITLQAAYAHHGEPDKQMLLANGKEGWVYTVGYAEKRMTSRTPSGEVRTSDVTDWALGVRNFTLVFDDRVVIDVIYKDDGTGIGVTAMELQYPRPKPRSGP